MKEKLTVEDIANTLGFMVYFKGPKDKRFSPIDIKTGELYSRLAYAPIYPHRFKDAVIAWIEENKKRAPECTIQIRRPGTGRIVYQ